MTFNTPVNNNWILVVAAEQEAFLVSWNNINAVEFATTSENNPPTVQGHLLQSGEALSRNTIGAGNLWARVSGGSAGTVVNLIVSA